MRVNFLIFGTQGGITTVNCAGGLILGNQM